MFLTDGVTLTDEAQHACDILKIDPKIIKPKTRKDFKEEGVDETVAKLRFDHFTTYRSKKLAQLISFLKSGMFNILTDD